MAESSENPCEKESCYARTPNGLRWWLDLSDDASAQKYALDALWKLSAAARQDKERLLGLFKADGSADVFVYSFGKGNTYLKRFRAATEEQKTKFRSEIRAQAARVKGEKSVKKRLATMGMTDDGVMTYRLTAKVACGTRAGSF